MKAELCNKCSVNLTDDNWYPSAKKRRWLICKVCANNRQRIYNKNNPHVVFKKNMERRYGLSYEDYLALLEKQNGRCAICNGTETHSTKKNLSVDHCHKTGKIRGLLCSNCNTALGKFQDSLELLDKAKEYLCGVNLST